MFKIGLVLVVFSISAVANGQNNYQLVGDAFGVSNINQLLCGESDTCFTLTQNLTTQAGAVWDQEPIDLLESFDATFCLYLGANDAGADGFAFVLRGLSSSNSGGSGGGIGYEGISDALAIEFDTWNNGTANDDIAEDHTGMYHNNNWLTPLVSSISLDPSGANVEDGDTHTTRIVWNANTQVIDMYFDGTLRMTDTIDLINEIFNGENEVFWGFTASTGGASNLQQICFPSRSIDLLDATVCYPDMAYLSYYTENITSYTWYTEEGDTLSDWNSIDYPFPFPLEDTIVGIDESGNVILSIDFNNNSYADTAMVLVVQNPASPFASDSLNYCPLNTLVVLDALNNGMSYTWNPIISNDQTIQIDSSQLGWYSVIIEEPINGCQNKDSIYVSTFCEPIIEFPNVFTPNNDGVNDFYEPIYVLPAEWVKIESFEIFNRWGNSIYLYTYQSDSSPKWDGKLNGKNISEGVYFYLAAYSNIKNENQELKQGSFHVFR